MEKARFVARELTYLPQIFLSGSCVTGCAVKEAIFRHLVSPLSSSSCSADQTDTVDGCEPFINRREMTSYETAGAFSAAGHWAIVSGQAIRRRPFSVQLVVVVQIEGLHDSAKRGTESD